MPEEEDISNGLKDLDFNVINLRQMMTTQRAHDGQTLPLFPVTLRRNKEPQDIFKIIVKDQLNRAQDWPHAVLQLQEVWPCQGQNSSNPFNVCGAVMECPEHTNTVSIWTWRETPSGIISRMQPCKSRTAKEKGTMISQGILWEDALL
jgi:hypothetical protein